MLLVFIFMRLFGAIIILLVGCVGISAAQEQSLGEAARQARQAKKPSNSNVIDNDAIAQKKGPIPDIAIKGTENSDDICAAIDTYRQKHTAAEFEDALHDWYSRHDEMLARIYHDQTIAGRLQRDRYLPHMNPYQNDDYNKYKEANVMEALNASVERDIASDSYAASNRLQQGLMKVRNRLQILQIRYPWFKVRYSNGTY